MPRFVRFNNAAEAFCASAIGLADLRHRDWLGLQATGDLSFAQGADQPAAGFVFDVRRLLAQAEGRITALFAREQPRDPGKTAHKIAAWFRSWVLDGGKSQW